MLCENRVEGFGPQSRIDSHLPTSCFSDVIVVPLATWIYLVILTIAISLLLLSSSPSTPNSTIHPSIPAKESTKTTTTSTSTSTTKDASITVENTATPASRNRGILRKTLKTLYYFLIAATIALLSLVIARLNTAQLGVGLLPFTYVGILTALVLHISTEPSISRQPKLQTSRLGGLGSTRWRSVVKVVNGLFWVLLTITVAIKIAVEVKEQRVLGDRIGQQAQYPLSDEITDDAVLIGVQCVLLFLEVILA